MTCGERTGHRIKSGELCRVSIGADSTGCFLLRTPAAVKRRWKLKGLKAMLAKKVPKEFIDGLEQQWTSVPGVQASLATMTKLLLLKAVSERQCRAFSASAAEHIKYLEAAEEKAASQNGLKSVNVMLYSSNGRGGGCRECPCTRCRVLFAEETVEAKTMTIDEPDCEPQSESSRAQRPRRPHQENDPGVEHPPGAGCGTCDERRAFTNGLTWRQRMRRFRPDQRQLLPD